jgi:hypothetical protein
VSFLRRSLAAALNNWVGRVFVVLWGFVGIGLAAKARTDARTGSVFYAAFGCLWLVGAWALDRWRQRDLNGRWYSRDEYQRSWLYRFEGLRAGLAATLGIVFFAVGIFGLVAHQ